MRTWSGQMVSFYLVIRPAGSFTFSLASDDGMDGMDGRDALGPMSG